MAFLQNLGHVGPTWTYLLASKNGVLVAMHPTHMPCTMTRFLVLHTNAKNSQGVDSFPCCTNMSTMPGCSLMLCEGFR